MSTTVLSIYAMHALSFALNTLPALLTFPLDIDNNSIILCLLGPSPTIARMACSCWISDADNCLRGAFDDDGVGCLTVVDFSLHRNVSVDQAIDILKEYDIEHRINRTKKKDMAKSNSKKMKFQLNTKEFDALPGTKKNPAASGRKFLYIMSFVNIYMVFLTFSFSFSFVHVFFLSFFLVFYFFHSFERMGQRSNKDSADDGRTADDERHSIFNY